MSSIFTILMAVSVILLVYHDAKSRGAWSWPAFFLILPLILIYAALCGVAAWFAVAFALAPGLGVALVLSIAFVGVVPLAIVAKRIYRHYVKAPR